MIKDAVKDNPLGIEPIHKLLVKFAVPSIIAMLVGACYNIVDQLFIGNVIGPLGNAATNLVFPFTNLCLSFGLLFGIGGAAAFNLTLGAGDKKRAPYFFGNAAVSLFLVGVIFAAIALIFMEPILMFFGTPDEVMPLAREYADIIALGFPFFIFSVGAGHLVRADGRPNVIMITNVIGGVINIGLDAWFILGLDMGMKGAALATIIGQIVAAVIQFYFVFKPKTLKVLPIHFVPIPRYFGRTAKLGLAPFVNQLSIMIVQIALNNALNHYGSLSEYGPSIPIAALGIVIKFTSIFSGIVIGLAQGIQPIASFNYGAEKYRRVKEAYFRVMIIAFIISILNFLLYQLFPDQILGLFGEGSELYFKFGRLCFRVFLFFVCLFFIQMITSTTFTAIGKPWKGMFLSLTRQILYFLPLMYWLGATRGIEGIVYAQPVADFLSILTAVIMMWFEFSRPEFKKEKGVLKEILLRQKHLET